MSALVLALAVLVLVQVAIRESRDDPPARATGSPTAAVVSQSGLLGPGDPFPSFTAPAMGGGRISWTQFVGTPTLVAVWAPWCPHCQAELPVLASVIEGFPSVRLLTVATAVDPHLGPTPRRYMRAAGLDFPVALDDPAGTLARALRVQAFPTLYFVDAGGTIRVVHQGEMPAEDVRSMLRSL
ncbi:MAG: TlpA family protein disulfide reductase [Candidatus Velamenicoccus archaeovorus]